LLSLAAGGHASLPYVHGWMLMDAIVGALSFPFLVLC